MAVWKLRPRLHINKKLMLFALQLFMLRNRKLIFGMDSNINKNLWHTYYFGSRLRTRKEY